ncbi:MAG: radical SAM family heme chaperone HemW [Desulfobacteraceae bacterium]|nr:radical SAM family heme chaperone HemW [Desulfobacteraceae bacterium]MBC2754198.1 radical SAM family heme chaperone HemW [Desulfobacteraceae bacterium]
MDESNRQKGGIYIHVPFCVKKCAYCDFYSCTDLEKIPSYVQSLIVEMNLTADFPLHADTLYIGGGTPSLLKAEQIQLLIDAAINRFQAAPDAEITIEVNPGTVNAEKLAGYWQAGVNRISIGVQSFSDASLDFLSRIHTADQAIQSIEFARSAGFDNIGLDLIYGLPGQTERMWQADLQTAINLTPEHLSCYMLTYEPGTKMENNLRNGRFRALPDKDVGRLYDFTVRYLEDNGFYQYEVSNFSTSRQSRSKHNQKYWTHAPYIGLGPSAHSLVDNRRSWNVRSLEAYLRKTGQGKLPIEETEELNSRQLMMETLYLRLRCVDGISILDFEKRFNIDFNRCFGSIVSTYESDGVLEIINNKCRLTRKGMLFADSISSRFIDAI